MLINKDWDFETAIKEISKVYYPGGMTSGQLRNRQVEAWGQLVGKTRALTEFDATIKRYGSLSAFGREYRATLPTLRRLKEFFESLPEDQVDSIVGMKKVFVSYSWDNDDHKKWVRDLAAQLRGDGIDVTLDQWHLVPGDQLPQFMERAIRESDYVLIVCTHKYKDRSDKRQGGVGYEGDIITAEFMATYNHSKFIPLLRQQSWNDSAPSWMLGKYYIDFSSSPYSEKSYDDLQSTILGTREKAPPIKLELIGKPSTNISLPNDLYKFVYFPLEISSNHEFWISKYPVTNIQYERFLKDPYFDPRVALTYKSEGMFDNRDYWKYHPMFEKHRAETKVTDNVVDTGYKWINERLAEPRKWYDTNGNEYLILPGHEPEGGRIKFPTYWGDADFGIARKNVPVVGVSWYEASAYCRWLQINWFNLEESKTNKIDSSWVRLPTRKEWEIAAGGRLPNGRYPWDSPNEITRDVREIFDRTNVANQIGKTTPVDKYPKDASPRGVMDMGGNVWEWLSNISEDGDFLAEIAGGVPEDEIPSYGLMQLIGGSWRKSEKDASLCEAFYGHSDTFPDEDGNDIGFRVVVVKT